MSITKRLTNQFKTTGDDGNKYDILEYTEFHQVSTFNSEPEEEEGLKEYMTRNGSPVNRLSETEFVIVIDGIKLKAN